MKQEQKLLAVILALFVFSISLAAFAVDPPKKNRKLGCAQSFYDLLSGGKNGGPPDGVAGAGGAGGSSPDWVILTSEQRQPVLSALNASFSSQAEKFPSLEKVTTAEVPGSPAPLRYSTEAISKRYDSLRQEVPGRKVQVPHIENTLAWLDKSIRDDLESAEVLFKGEKWGTTCYHAQQAAEKALKAVLVHYGIVAEDKDFKKNNLGHNLANLLAEVKSKVANPEVGQWVELAEAVSKLNPLATRYRYPSADTPNPTAAEAQNALDLARTVVGLSLSAVEGR